jgi:hypothetical protein
VRVAWGSTMMTDLQTKVANKAAQCEERARQATDGPQRAFYEGVCSEKLNPDVVAMKSAKDRI